MSDRTNVNCVADDFSVPIISDYMRDAYIAVDRNVNKLRICDNADTSVGLYTSVVQSQVKG